LIGQFSVEDIGPQLTTSNGLFGTYLELSVTYSLCDSSTPDPYSGASFSWLQLNVSVTTKEDQLTRVGRIEVDSLERFSIRGNAESLGNLHWYLRSRANPAAARVEPSPSGFGAWPRGYSSMTAVSLVPYARGETVIVGGPGSFPLTELC